MIIQLISKFKPTPQARPRVVSQGRKTFAYDPTAKDKREFLKSVKYQIPEIIEKKQAWHLWIEFKYPRPKKFINVTELKPARYVTKRPDIDNLIKFVLDALNGIIWYDDSYVVSITAIKLYDTEQGIKITACTEEDL